MPSVQERLSELTSLCSELSTLLDVNDQTTLNETVNDTCTRLNMVVAAAGLREKSLLTNVALWNDFQVCRSPSLSTDAMLCAFCCNSVYLSSYRYLGDGNTDRHEILHWVHISPGGLLPVWGQCPR